MVAAAIDWIHDTNTNQQYADLWNHSTLAIRAKLLKDATRDPYQKHLSWEALSELVRADVIYAIQRQEKEVVTKAEGENRKSQHHTIAADDPRLWWNKDKV